jgi:hypothetical protein
MIHRCTPRGAKRMMTKILTAGLVPFLQSSPGMGKSSITRSIAEDFNLELIDHRLSTSEPTDMTGLPWFKDGFAAFAPFRELFPLQGDELPPGKDGWLLFLDEFNSASKQVQAASYKLILDRMVGQHKLHDNVIIVCAGNLSTDKAIVNALSTAMQSRVVHLEMVIDFDEWLYDVALKQKYDPRVVGFLSQFPSKLMDFSSSHKDKTFCCPRTWEFMERMVRNEAVVSDEDAPMYAGCITSGVATEFIQFTKVFASLVTMAQILKDPLGTPVPSDVSTKWATISTIMEKVDEKNFGPVTEYINRFDMSFKVLFYRSVMVNHPDLRSHAAFAGAMRNLAQYLKG